MSAFMVLFSLFWMSVAFVAAGPFFLFGVFFLAIGLYGLIGVHLVDARRRSRTVYAVTGDRVIILSELRGARVTSLQLDTLTDVSFREARGHGTILFGPDAQAAYGMWMHWWPGMPRPAPRFELGEDARQVYDIVIEARRRAVG